jgi:DNA-binding transcriptional MocR family regulator
MSHFMTALAMKQRGLKPAAKIVLYWLADHHNGETGECFPSIARLADVCEMSRRSVEIQLATLEEAGLIARTNQFRTTGGKTSNKYTLRLAQTEMDNCDAQNLRIPSENSAHTHTQNMRMNNPVINNPVNINLFGAEAAKPSKQKKAIALPENWVPSDKNTADAQERGFTMQEIDHEADQFRNYHLAKGSTFKNWDAAWRTWLGNARKFAGRNSKQALSDTERNIAAFAATNRRKPSEDLF